MNKSEKFIIFINKSVKILLSAFIKMAIFLMFIGFFEHIFISLDIGEKTPTIILHLIAFVLYLVTLFANNISKAIKNHIRSKEKNEKNSDFWEEDEDEKNDEDFF
ncbi:MAG: hypothetical protein JW924_10335 [Fusobacteriaceae bacterium]|nr:hypothetical protein [Fusobacteriaceae bacterium]